MRTIAERRTISSAVWRTNTSPSCGIGGTAGSEMCGICGELRFDGAPVQPDAVVAMREQLIHRGPDAAGLFVSPSRAAALGFRRLSIVDLSPNGHQPIPNEDGRVQVAFNGEIYNFAGIREELVAKGHVFRSRTDSEVIAHLYEELGPGCIDRLDGM